MVGSGDLTIEDVWGEHWKGFRGLYLAGDKYVVFPDEDLRYTWGEDYGGFL